jgi:hypothetical protein
MPPSVKPPGFCRCLTLNPIKAGFVKKNSGGLGLAGENLGVTKNNTASSGAVLF